MRNHQTPALCLNNFGAKGFGGRWQALGAKGEPGGRAPAPWMPGSSRARPGVERAAPSGKQEAQPRRAT